MTSIIKVDNLQNQCGANIISESANVITIGASGDTVTLAAGASQSGFGRSGSVNWDTTPKTSSPVTAVSGNGYFINTTSGAITVNLPSTPAAGDIVAIADYANTSATNNITVGRNGSNIDGEAKDAFIFVNGQVYTLVYVDATEGWKTVGQTFNQITLPTFITATGGTITCDGDYKIHSFTGPGTFTVTSVGNPVGSTTVDYMVVAGGGAGGGRNGSSGGGGAGGFRESSGAASGCYSTSPLGSGVSALPVSVQGYPITVGGGGAFVPATCGASVGGNGSNSVFSTITSTGGGGGGGNSSVVCRVNGAPGGSGGGAGSQTTCAGSANFGLGNTPPTSPSQGNNGGNEFAPLPLGPQAAGGGGGGAGGVGGNASSGVGGARGNGVTTNITSSPVSYAQGGGASFFAPGSPGGLGGNNPTPATTSDGISGGTNTGGGGGGAGNNNATGNSGAGGSGIVVIRYKFQ
jgi:hypothetical protein